MTMTTVTTKPIFVSAINFTVILREAIFVLFFKYSDVKLEICLF